MEKRLFKYGKMFRIAVCLSAIFGIMAIYIFKKAFERYQDGDQIFFIIGVPFVVLTIVSALLLYRDVTLSDEGVGRIFLGYCSSFIRWDEIVSVRCDVISKKDGSVKSYHLRRTAGNPFGGVSIMSMIDDVDTLVEAIDRKVRENKIPVSAWDVNTLVHLDHLPPPTKDPAAWR